MSASFDWKNLKMMTWQTQDSYDEQGRYRPELFTKFGQQFPIIDFTAAQVRLTLDNLHFRKQLIATSGVDTTRNITPEWLLRPFTVSYYQLKRDVGMVCLAIDDYNNETTKGSCKTNLKQLSLISSASRQFLPKWITIERIVLSVMILKLPNISW